MKELAALANSSYEEMFKVALKEFYDRVFKDPELGPFFKNANEEGIARMCEMMQTVLVTADEFPSQVYMRHAHFQLVRFRGLQRKHLERFIAIFAETMRDAGFPEKVCEELTASMSALSDPIMQKIGQLESLPAYLRQMHRWDDDGWRFE